jgi:CheY-like chemotaxis protein
MAATPYFNERSCTILVVEEEALIRSILHIVLKGMGHVVLEARDGADGLTVSRSFNGRIDLVIADVQMPKMDGLTMIRLLQAKRPGMKVFLMSGRSAESVQKHWMKKFFAQAVSTSHNRAKGSGDVGLRSGIGYSDPAERGSGMSL